MKRDVTTILKSAFLNMFLKKQDEVNPDDKLDGYNVPEEEINVVEDFLNLFLIMPESVQKDLIDIKIMVKALPNKIMSCSL